MGPNASSHPRLQVGTWNVNGRDPEPGLDLSPWISAEGSPSIVVVGFQVR